MTDLDLLNRKNRNTGNSYRYDFVIRIDMDIENQVVGFLKDNNIEHGRTPDCRIYFRNHNTPVYIRLIIHKNNITKVVMFLNDNNLRFSISPCFDDKGIHQSELCGVIYKDLGEIYRNDILIFSYKEHEKYEDIFRFAKSKTDVLNIKPPPLANPKNIFCAKSNLAEICAKHYKRIF